MGDEREKRAFSSISFRKNLHKFVSVNRRPNYNKILQYGIKWWYLQIPICANCAGFCICWGKCINNKLYYVQLSVSFRRQPTLSHTHNAYWHIAIIITISFIITFRLLHFTFSSQLFNFLLKNKILWKLQSVVAFVFLFHSISLEIRFHWTYLLFNIIIISNCNCLSMCECLCVFFSREKKK